MHSSQDHSEKLDSEISLLDIVQFLQESWKKLAISAIVGAVLGLAAWLFLGSYTAEYVLLNNSNSNIPALDIVSWKMLQKGLPNLAAQIIEEGKTPENDLRTYRSMSSDQWWQKNAVPGYALSKADMKDLAGVSKDLDGASTTILSLTLTGLGSTKEQAIDNVRAAASFLRTGGAYMQIRSLLNSYESQALSTRSELAQKITSSQIEMAYQQERLKKLEDLRKQYPTNQTANVSQTISNTDAGGKYFPLTTQIIAANADINESKEKIDRLQKRLEQITLARSFLDQALPLQDQTFDGLALTTQLLKIEGDLRAKLSKDDFSSAEFLDNLHAQLSVIQARFTKGLEANTPPTSSGKKGMIKLTVGGLGAAFFLMLLVLLGQRVWQSIKVGGAK